MAVESAQQQQESEAVGVAFKTPQKPKSMIELSGSEEDYDDMDEIWDEIEKSPPASKNVVAVPLQDESQSQSQDDESQKLSLGFDETQSQSQSQQAGLDSHLP